MIDELIKALTPWVEREREEKAADSEKFLEVREILDPDTVSDWCGNLQSNFEHRNHSELIDSYTRFIERPDSFFNRRKLRKKYISLNNNFTELKLFLMTHLFVNENNTDFFVLHPELRSNNPEEYRRYSTELQSLVSKFYKSYSEFIKTGTEKYVGTYTLMGSILLIIGIPSLVTTLINPSVWGPIIAWLKGFL